VLTTIRAQLTLSFDARLVDELLASHAEAKRNLYLGGLRLSEVEGGRFCEAAFRLLEQGTTHGFTPLGVQLDIERLIQRLSGLPKASFPDSVRLHIPRALRMVYDIRNKRDAAHLADGIDPNLQDSSLVVSVIDWVLAEFVRLYHKVNADEAQVIVQNLVTRTAPVIQDFNGHLKVLNPDLTASDHCLVLLYHRGAAGATFGELSEWVRPPMRANLKRILYRLVHEKDLLHSDEVRYYITRRGQIEVESKRLVDASASS
jgi:hypothetical protein